LAAEVGPGDGDGRPPLAPQGAGRVQLGPGQDQIGRAELGGHAQLLDPGDD
jgi:hypothetical protein